jgi:hypothetical protein
MNCNLAGNQLFYRVRNKNSVPRQYRLNTRHRFRDDP